MSKHTPTPWLVDAMGNIWAKDTKIAEMSMQPPQSDHHYRVKSDEEHEANAHHIVKCVNYHDRLVDCLKESISCEFACTETVVVDKIEALLAELSAHNGGEG